MTRPAATLITIATVALCAGCGGGSSKKGATTHAPQVGPYPIVAKEGEFQTLIPRGYVNHPAVTQYWADGPTEGRVQTSILVVRQAVGRQVSISTYAREVARAFRPITRRLSRLQPEQVGGEPAFALDYFVTGTGTQKGVVTHNRQLLVKHGAWVFFIRIITSPTQYAESLGALDEVLGHWRWL